MVQPLLERRSHERGRVAAIAIVWSRDRGAIRYVVEDLSASGALLSGGPELADLGHHVACAWTLEQATAKIHDPYVRFDIAIVDLSVGALEGLELLRQIAGTHPGVHRVLMSGRVSHGQLKLAEIMGKADVILPKPWTRRALLAAMPI